MAGRLQDQDMDQLEQWIGMGPKTFTLLYSITRDGCNAQTFHQKCNNQGPTVTVLYNPSGSVYGGYTGQSWASRQSYVSDTTAFLFRLKYNKSQQPVKFVRNGNGNEIYDHVSYGPTFGAGHDLQTFSNYCNQSGGTFTLNGYMDIVNCYTSSVNANQINNGNMNVTELEVYQVTDGKRQPKTVSTVAPWRKTPIWDKKLLDELAKDIVSFKPPPGLKIQEARLLMIGPVGAGKSSFFNTISSIFRGRLSQKANCGSADQSLTTEYTPYKVRVQSGATLNFRLCDTRGLEESQGLDVLECQSLLDGHVPDRYQFNPATPITAQTPGYIKSPTVGDRIHCVLFVVDSTTLDVLPAKVTQKIKSFQPLMNQRGIIQVVVLTKIDRLSKDVAENISGVFGNPEVEKIVDKASSIFGLPRGNILPVKNYENEAQLEGNISILALLALRQILNFTQDCLENILDRQEDTDNV